MRADMRFLTAIAVIGICGFSIAQGLRVVHFALAMASIDSAENRAEALSRWTAVPGIRLEALQSQVNAEIDPSDLKAAASRREALAAILSIKPLSPIDWLSLSGMQLITDQPMDQVLGSLTLSIMTGPNEGYVMVDRGIFGVSVWERLSPDLQRRTAMDLTAEEVLNKNETFRTVLSAKPIGVRNEVQAAILETGLAPKEVERRLGY
jgi:hypothetical protein